jgi:hypothetical protein
MSVIEQGLTNHRDVIAQLFQEQHPPISQEEIPKPIAAWDSPLDGCPGSARASKEEATSQRDRPPTRTDIHDLKNGRTVRSKTSEQRQDELTDSSTVEISRQHTSPQAKNAASQGSMLHKSDFIQDLSE